MDPVSWEQYPEVARTVPDGYTPRRLLVRVEPALWRTVFELVPKG